MMTEQNNILKNLQLIFSEVFQRNDLVISESTTAMTIPEWDSFSNIDLILQIEKEFNIQFNLKELRKLNTVGDLCETISHKICIQ